MTDRQTIVESVETWVRERPDTSRSRAHGWLHVDRVRRNILILAAAEGVDPFLAELAALLHDVGRTLPGPENEHGARSAVLVEPLVAELPLTDKERQMLLHAVRWHNSGRDETALLCILRDADMLDGLGAMGIIRAFMSRSHLPPYDPSAPFDRDRAQWPAKFSSDQLLGQMEWHDWLNTDTAREMARDRIAPMDQFVAQALREA